MTLDDLATPDVDVIVVDNQPVGTVTSRGLSTHQDVDPIVGSVVFGGMVGDFFVGPTTGGVSKPVLGALNEARIDLHLDLAYLGFSVGRFQAIVTDTDFQLADATFPWLLSSRIGGIGMGTVEFQEAFDAGNAEFGASTVNGPVFLSDLAFDASLTSHLMSANPFSLTESVIATQSPGGFTVLDAESHVSPIPEPVSITCWAAVGLLAVCTQRFRRRRGLETKA